MLKRKVPIWFALPMLLAIAGALFALVSQKAEASLTKKPKVWSNEDCLKCHTNKKVLARMQDKRGDSSYCQAAFDNLKKGDAPDTKSWQSTKSYK